MEQEPAASCFALQGTLQPLPRCRYIPLPSGMRGSHEVDLLCQCTHCSLKPTQVCQPDHAEQQMPGMLSMALAATVAAWHSTACMLAHTRGCPCLLLLLQATP